MFYNSVNGSLFKGIVLNGYNNLIRDMAMINNLNVFPVPDGDTGTNMKKTLENGINNLTFNDGVEEQIGEVSDILAKGMLLGARGNSGVILSQYFKGIAKHKITPKEKTISKVTSIQRSKSLEISIIRLSVDAPESSIDLALKNRKTKAISTAGIKAVKSISFIANFEFVW